MMHAISEDKLLILGGRDHTFQDFLCNGASFSKDSMQLTQKLSHGRIGRYLIIREGNKKIKPRLPIETEEESECLFKTKPAFTFAVIGSQTHQVQHGVLLSAVRD